MELTKTITGAVMNNQGIFPLPVEVCVVKNGYIHNISMYNKEFDIKITIPIEKVSEMLNKETNQGQWDDKGNCSVCGKNIYDDIDADIWSRYAPSFCPNCGAEMNKVERKEYCEFCE